MEMRENGRGAVDDGGGGGVHRLMLPCVISRTLFAVMCSALFPYFGLLLATLETLQIGVSFLLLILMVIFVFGVAHYWASNNFYLTRKQMICVSFIAFLLTISAFLLGWSEGRKGRLLGDCWFLSAVAVLTEASKISEVIITPEYNEE